MTARPGGALADDLRGEVRGDVWFDRATRALYATDASNYRQAPLGVVCPRDADDVAAALRVAAAHDVPLTARGAGTSLAGQSVNVGLILDTGRHMRAILEVDPERRIARVQPGVVLDDLRRETEKVGLTFGPDPATHAWCTIGGMLGNDSCGTHALVAGKTGDNVERLRVVAYGGETLDVGAYGDAAEAGPIPWGAVWGRSDAWSRRTTMTSGPATRRWSDGSAGSRSTGCCPSRGSTWRARSWGPRAPASRWSKRRCSSSTSRPTDAWSCWAIGTCSRPPTRCRACWSIRWWASRGSTRRSSTRCARVRSTWSTCRCCPTVARGSTRSWRATRGPRRTRPRAPSWPPCRRARSGAGSMVRPSRRGSGSSGNRGWAPRPSARTGSTTSRAGRMPPCPPSAWASTFAR